MADLSSDLARAVARAIDAGDTAAASTRQIALRNTDPTARDISVVQRLTSGLARVVGGPAITADQIRRACDELDRFSEVLRTANDHLTDPEDRLDTHDGAGERLWGSVREAASIHNEVNATLARLGRYRVNLVLGQPLRTRHDD